MHEFQLWPVRMIPRNHLSMPVGRATPAKETQNPDEATSSASRSQTNAPITERPSAPLPAPRYLKVDRVNRDSLEWLGTGEKSESEKWLCRAIKFAITKEPDKGLNLPDSVQLKLSPSQSLSASLQQYGARGTWKKKTYVLGAYFALMQDGSLKLVRVTMRDALNKHSPETYISLDSKTQILDEQKSAPASSSRVQESFLPPARSVINMADAQDSSQGSAKRPRVSPPTEGGSRPAAQRQRRGSHGDEVIDLTAPTPAAGPLPVGEPTLEDLQNDAKEQSYACARALQGYAKQKGKELGALFATEIEGLNLDDVWAASSMGISDPADVKKYRETRTLLLRELEKLGKLEQSPPEFFVNEKTGKALESNILIYRAKVGATRRHTPIVEGPSATASSSTAKRGAGATRPHKPIVRGPSVAASSSAAKSPEEVRKFVEDAESDARTGRVSRHTVTQWMDNRKVLMVALVNAGMVKGDVVTLEKRDLPTVISLLEDLQEELKNYLAFRKVISHRIPAADQNFLFVTKDATRIKAYPY